MTPAAPPTVFLTLAPIVLAGLILLALRVLMARSPANLCLAGFLACLIPSPLMLVVHVEVATAMIGIGLACAVPAYLLAEDHNDEGRDDDADDPDPPGPEPDHDLWREFERDFWSHLERTRQLVTA